MNKLNVKEQARIIRALVEGNSINSTCRMFGIAKTTILRLIRSFGAACQKFHDDKVQELTTTRCEVDFAQLVKVYGLDQSVGGKYSPPECIGIKVKPRTGNPDPKLISTSFVERSNLTVRMGVRRYTRLTNAHSKKLENHIAMTNIFFVCYNFCRNHMTLGTTPAVAAGLIDRRLEVEELLEMCGLN